MVVDRQRLEAELGGHLRVGHEVLEGVRIAAEIHERQVRAVFHQPQCALYQYVETSFVGVGLRGNVVELLAILDLGLARAHGLELRGDRGSVEDADRREQRPDLQRHDARERTVGVTERRAGLEHQAQRECGRGPQHDRQRRPVREPRPRRLPAARRQPEQQRHRRADEHERDRPAHDVPDRARFRAERGTDVATKGEHQERSRRARTGGDAEEQREAVLLQRWDGLARRRRCG